jgi:predicted O-linked N-acetylglucosamine transferase (SPINDLY family)
LGGVLKDIGEPQEAIQCLRRAIAALPSYHTARSNLLFLSHLDEEFNQEALFEEAKAYGLVVESKATRSMTWSNVRDPERRLRIGFVSGDLCFHPVGFFIEGVLRALSNRPSANLEVFAYMNFFRIDSVSERIKSLCKQWREIHGLTDEETAYLIREDEIDILFDLSGHSGGNRLPVFAWKPAPVQATWLGYFDTTGVAAIDYLIADPITLPESEEVFFTEKIWRLPDTRLCFTPPEIDITIRPLPALSEGVITFGCFSSLTKMGNPVVALWARVLLAIPNSRLFLKTRQFYEPSMREAAIERFRQHGVDPARLILEGPESRTNYLAAYNRIDIGLDPFPYTGGTTTAESLWMGVPVLTLAGGHFLARQGEGLLVNAGLPDWVARDTDDYVAKAVFHASNLERLAALHSSLRERVLASPIFDSARFAMHFEEAIRGMWRAWCAGTQQPTPNRHDKVLNPANSKQDAS